MYYCYSTVLSGNMAGTGARAEIRVKGGVIKEPEPKINNFVFATLFLSELERIISCLSYGSLMWAFFLCLGDLDQPLHQGPGAGQP